MSYEFYSFLTYSKKEGKTFSILSSYGYHASLTIGLILSMSLENLWNVKNFES